MVYDTMKYQYKTYLAEQAYEQSKLENYIKECYLLCSNTICEATIESLNEGVINKGKELITKLFNTISTLFAKFVEKLTAFTNNEKGYLEKYKDIILTKVSPKKYEYADWHDYKAGLARMDALTIGNKELDLTNTTKMESIKEVEDYQKEFGVGITDANGSFNDKLLKHFRGDSITTTSDKMSMKDMYDFCYGFEAQKNHVQTSMDEITKLTKNAINKINSLPAPAAPPETDGESKTESYYSAVYKKMMIVTEAEGKPTVKEVSTDAAATTAKADGTPTVTMQATASDDDKTASISVLKIYMTVLGDVLASKLTFITEIRNNYMTAIRNHVQSIVGHEKNEKDTVPASAATSGNKAEASTDDIDKVAKAASEGKPAKRTFPKK